MRRWLAECVRGRSWGVRAPLVAVLAWIATRHAGDPTYASIFQGVNLGFHEMGHAALYFSGHRLLTVAAGTLFEIGVPVAAGAYLVLRQRDPFGGAVCLFWLGTALVGVGIYAADARIQALPLVSPFGPVDVDSHDWTYILLRFGRISRAEAIGGFIRRAGLVAMVVSLALQGFVLRAMADSHDHRGPDASVREGARHP